MEDDDMRWETLESQTALQTSWFRIRADKCKTPVGKIVEPYYVWDSSDWAIAVALTKEGQFIMVKQFRQALGALSVEVPGGVIDPTDADPAAGVKRELMEETGYTFESVELLHSLSPNPAINDNRIHMFLAQGGTKVAGQDLDPNEQIKVLLMDKTEVFEMLQQGEIMHSLHATALFYAFLRLGFLG